MGKIYAAKILEAWNVEHQNPFSYAEFLRIFEHDDWFLIDETVFYLDYAPDEEYYLGCLREY